MSVPVLYGVPAVKLVFIRRFQLSKASSLLLSVALIVPATLVVANGSIHATCAGVHASISHVHAVVRIKIVLVAIFCILANVTTSLSIVHTVPLDVSVISPLSPSVRVGIEIFPDQSTVTQLIVLMFVPETRVSCFPAIALASSLSALRLAKFVLNFVMSVSAGVSDVVRVWIVDILCWDYSS